MNHIINRRKFIQLGAASAASIGPLAKAAEVCLGKTPAQTEGPFYPIQDQADKDWDLTQVVGHTSAAKGELMLIMGRVLDQNCDPVEGALVEIWQACATGKYNHPNDPNTAVLDPNFQYWGQAATSADGAYKFKTIKPGAYPADVGWWRPPHIHYKVHKRGYFELTTQLYFANESYNATDKILQRLAKAEQKKVVRPIEQGVVTFDLNIEKI